MTAAPAFRVLRRRLDWELSAAEALRLVRADPHPVALLGAWAGGSDIVASSPARVCQAPSVLADVLDAPLARPDGPPAACGANHVRRGVDRVSGLRPGREVPAGAAVSRGAPPAPRLVLRLLRPCAAAGPRHRAVVVRDALDARPR